MTIQTVTIYADGVRVFKIQTSKGVLSWFIDQWDLFDVFVTFNDGKKSFCKHSQNDDQFNGIVRDFLK